MVLNGVPLHSNYLGLLGLATAISLLLIRPTQVAASEPPAEWAAHIIHVMGRWALLSDLRIQLRTDWPILRDRGRTYSGTDIVQPGAAVAFTNLPQRREHIAILSRTMRLSLHVDS
jgi:hypothetical protein